MADAYDTRAQRAANYRKMAKEADDIAATNLPEPTRQAYLELAKGWHKLADETDRGPAPR